ncbi:ALP1-like protein [Tanacetum coccineum]
MQFIYVLPGWEGSMHDGRVLMKAISRDGGLKVPQGCFYLMDARYCNARGFLAPFRGERYHLNEFHGQQPQSAEEYFNMKHSKARNVIERCFGLVKGRWKILASPSFFPIGTQVHIILACCFLHNLIRKYMSFDPLEFEQAGQDEIEGEEPLGDEGYLTHINPTDEWVLLGMKNVVSLWELH